MNPTDAGDSRPWCLPSRPCPLQWAPPFLAPRRRALTARARQRLTRWCHDAVSDATPEIVEWVGTDGRNPPHAVVVSFPHTSRRPVVVYAKAEDIAQRDLRAALQAGPPGRCGPTRTGAR